MIQIIRDRWKALSAAAVQLSLVFGVGLPDGFADHSTELVVQTASAGQALYVGGRALIDYLRSLRLR